MAHRTVPDLDEMIHFALLVLMGVGRLDLNTQVAGRVEQRPTITQYWTTCVHDTYSAAVSQCAVV